MLDQLTIGEKKSLDDFDASISGRRIGIPAKKSIKETFLFSSKSHDFSKMNGELYWEERELEYEFEITAATPSELEQKKTAFSNWIMNVMNEKIHDPFIPGYHFVGTFEAMEYEDDESLEKTVATVTFKAYPFKIENEEILISDTVSGSALSSTFYIDSSSSRRISVDFCTDRSMSLTVGDKRFAFSGITPGKDDLTVFENAFDLEPGTNEILISDIEKYEEYRLTHGDGYSYSTSDLLLVAQSGGIEIYESYVISTLGKVNGSDGGFYDASVFTNVSAVEFADFVRGKYFNIPNGNTALQEVLSASETEITTAACYGDVYRPSARIEIRFRNEVL